MILQAKGWIGAGCFHNGINWGESLKCNALLYWAYLPCRQYQDGLAWEQIGICFELCLEHYRGSG